MHKNLISHSWLAEASAVVMLLSGVVLTYLSFFLGGRGEVADSVALLYGAVFGLRGQHFRGFGVYAAELGGD